MSGSDIGLGDGPSADIACSALIINAQIATPNPAYIGLIELGEVLKIELINLNDQYVVAVMRSNGDRLGGLAGGAIRRLRDCLFGGTLYRARVTRVSGPQIILRIEPFEPGEQ